jgi:hypothetical protein
MLIRNHHYRSSSNELIKICINNQDLKDNEQINYYVNIISYILHILKTFES